MSLPAIRVEELGKRYRIGQREPYRALRDVMAEAAKAPLRMVGTITGRNRTSDKQADRYVWAIKDVSFEVGRGEVLGIVGRNGAGKSTLLKILSRVTGPTLGHARIHGRVGSLLEVGTGFHPELTGRENVYLNGTILGMRGREIDRKFDDIVAFAEVERFIDTPVKRYSSGMQVRLAFAVAAHLEPEILMVDEVLAVGDVTFQKKCLGKMGDAVKEGRTILFVSHNMPAILSLCPRAIMIDAGRLVADAPSRQVVDRYLRVAEELAVLPLGEREDRSGSQRLRFVGVELRDSIDAPAQSVSTGRSMSIALRYESSDGLPLRNVQFAIPVHGKFDERLFHLSTNVTGDEFGEIPAHGVVVCRIARLPLQPGTYSFNVFSTVNDDIADWVQNAGTITVEADDFFGTGRLPPANQGAFLVPHEWEISLE